MTSATTYEGVDGPHTGGGTSGTGSGLGLGMRRRGGGGGSYDNDQEDDIPMSYLQGLRLELEDSESKLGVYAITDAFLSLLEALLIGSASISTHTCTRPAHDVLGASVRYPGILHYLEYVFFLFVLLQKSILILSSVFP